MSHRDPRRILLVSAILLSAMAACGCRSRNEGGQSDGRPPAVVDSKLRYNRLSAIPSAVHQSQAQSPVFWQPWTKETLDLAKKSQRLLFVVVALPQQTSYLRVMESIGSNPRVVAVMNHEYVPVLVDADASREMGLMMAELCGELQRPLQMPIFLWMTYEGDPVAWMPAQGRTSREICDLFDHSHATVGRMWREDPDYMLRNSMTDNGTRKERMTKRLSKARMSDNPERDVILAIRQLTSLYDPYTGGFDQTGGLFPSSLAELLAVVSGHPGVPNDLRAKSRMILEEMLGGLLPSPMFDPLDGGVFSSRRGTMTWSLPSFMRDCSGQARVVTALVEAHLATGNPLALERAKGALRFAEANYKTPEGLYAVGGGERGSLEDWMWTIEDIRALLPTEQADWWIREAGIKGLGNLPSEADPMREFFRSNTLALSKPLEVLAAESGMGREEFMAMFDSSREKLLAARSRKLNRMFGDESAHAASTFRMVSAHAAMFTVTEDEKDRRKAVELLSKARESFMDGRYLRNMKKGAPDSISLGRAFPHALALQAALDVAAITDLPEWKLWAEDLATISAELFTGEGFLRECPPAGEIIHLPITDPMMLFDDSSAGMFSMAETRLAALGRPLIHSFSELVTPMPTYIVERPVLHTDLLLATLLRYYPITVVYGADAPEDLKSAILGMSIRSVLRRDATERDEVPAGAVKVRWHDREEKVLRNAGELRDWLAGFEK